MMAAWRIVGSLGCLLAVTAVQAEPVPLVETVQPGDCFRITLAMKLGGEMKIQKNGEAANLKLEAAANHAFTERTTFVIGKYGKIAATLSSADDKISPADHVDQSLAAVEQLNKGK